MDIHLHPLSDEYLNDFLAGYLESSLWCGIDLTTGETFEDQDIDRFTPAARATLAYEALGFVEANVDDLTEIQALHTSGEWSAAEQAGHDFALTKAGHGAGFWDRGYGAPGERLSDASRVYGECMMWTNPDGTVDTDG